MNLNLIPINIIYLNKIKSWRYEGCVKSIYCEPYYQSFKEKGVFIGPGDCIGFAVLWNDELFGLFEYYFNDEIMEIGLAINPKYVGKGYGVLFVRQGIDFGVSYFNYRKPYVKLSVNVSNYPAIRVYEKVGFKVMKRSENELEMHYEL